MDDRDHGQERDQGVETTGNEGVLYCYAHKDTETRLRCTRCDRPICGRCAIPASVGQHCPECVAEARRTAPKVRSTMAATAPGVVGILGLNGVFFLLQIMLPELTGRLGLSPRAIAAGEWWRLLTPMVLHAGGIHILFNSIVLWVYGPNVEKAFGTARFLMLYVISGFAASSVSYAFSSPNILGVGASGAIFGVVGVLLVFLYNRRTQQFVAQFMRGLMTFVALNLFLGYIVPRIDNFAHIGGLVAGIILGWGFDRSGRSAQALQLLTGAAVVAGSLILVAGRSAGTL